MSLTFTTADEVLKQDYHGPVREQINNTVFLTSQIAKNTEDVVGRHAIVPIHLRRTSGVGARKEYGTLPTAGSQGYEDARVPLRHQYGRIELSGPIIKAMSKDRGAFVRAVDSETQGLRDDLGRDVNRQMHGTANGVIAKAGTTTASTTLVLDSGVTDTQIRQLWNQGGMVLDVGTVAAPTTTASGLGVTAFDTTNKTITVDSAVTTSGTDYLFRSGNGGQSDNSGKPGGQDGQLEVTGIQALVDDSIDIQTIDTSAEPVWASNVVNVGGAISEILINKAIQDTEIVSGKKINLLLANAPVHRGIAELMRTQRRSIDNVELEAGYSGVKWSAVGEGAISDPTTVALVWDQDCKENTLYGLSTDALVEYLGCDWEWMDDDGAVLSRVPNKDAYEATMFKYHEIATTHRNAHFRLDGITQTS